MVLNFTSPTIYSTIPINERFQYQHDDVLLLPGPGHIELNSARLLLKFLWQPLFSTLASLLGFRTPKAKEVMKAGIDHHRSRQILFITLEALTKELLFPYVHHSIRSDQSPMNEAFESWLENVKDQSYLFYFHITFSYLLAFQLFTEAV